MARGGGRKQVGATLRMGLRRRRPAGRGLRDAAGHNPACRAGRLPRDRGRGGPARAHSRRGGTRELTRACFGGRAARAGPARRGGAGQAGGARRPRAAGCAAPNGWRVWLEWNAPGAGVARAACAPPRRRAAAQSRRDSPPRQAPPCAAGGGRGRAGPGRRGPYPPAGGRRMTQTRRAAACVQLLGPGGRLCGEPAAGGLVGARTRAALQNWAPRAPRRPPRSRACLLPASESVTRHCRPPACLAFAAPIRICRRSTAPFRGGQPHLARGARHARAPRGLAGGLRRLAAPLSPPHTPLDVAVESSSRALCRPQPCCALTAPAAPHPTRPAPPHRPHAAPPARASPTGARRGRGRRRGPGRVIKNGERYPVPPRPFCRPIRGGGRGAAGNPPLPPPPERCAGRSLRL
jgi:hypothetical protein